MAAPASGPLPVRGRAHRHKRRQVLQRAGPMFTVLMLGVVAASIAFQYAAGDADAPEGHMRRELYEYAPGVCDSFLVMNNKFVGMALLIWGIFYMFWGLAIVCDDYFVASLEAISEDLGLSEDVAGATFMAAGSSAPELFTSVMGVFAVKNDVGIGTIVGSAVFNLCCIIGGTALFTPTVLVIDWKPITRDTFFYMLSIVAMIYVLQDGMVTMIEAAALIACYFLYVLFMVFNPTIMTKVGECCGESAAKVDEDDKDDEEEEEESGPISQAIAKPLSATFSISIPDCSTEEGRSKYLITFIMSIIWIGVLSYFMVTWASKLGCIWNIHPAIMGVTILAAGTSVPDAIGSLIVARQGKGDMAVSNAIGSNVFDILLGLGLPWVLSGIVYSEQAGIPVDAENILPMSFILVGTLVAVYVVTLMSGFRLTKLVGLIFFSFYFIFVAYNLLHEFEMIPF